MPAALRSVGVDFNNLNAIWQISAQTDFAKYQLDFRIPDNPADRILGQLAANRDGHDAGTHGP